MASVYRSLIASRSRACLLATCLDSAAGEIPSVRRIVSRMRLAKSPSPSSASPSLHFRLPLYKNGALPFHHDDEVPFKRPYQINFYKSFIQALGIVEQFHLSLI